MAETKPRLGYLGLGLMGLPMTLRLVAAGYPVTVWNRSREKILPALEAGAAEADSPRAVAEASEVVFACLSDAAAVEAVVFGGHGVSAADGAGKVFVDHSSIRPEAAREMAARLEAEHGMAWIDAPVSGGVAGAEAGTLAIMAGGEARDFERVRAIVAHTAQRFTLMGPVGAGQITKLVNQVIAGCAMVVHAEAVRLATNAGIDAAKLPECLKGGFADSLPFQIFVPRMLEGAAQPLGHVTTLLKDVETALELGRESAAPMPMTAAAVQIYRLMVAQGHAQSEPSVLYAL
ncbi:MAG: NAD(P)-dependent oxidoreductase, partial [Alphaproteobacteria bacterium]